MVKLLLYKRTNEKHSTISNNWQHFNLLHSIHKLKQTILLQVGIHHLKGHQDNHITFQHLLWQKHLNTIVDSEAKSFFQIKFQLEQ